MITTNTETIFYLKERIDVKNFKLVFITIASLLAMVSLSSCDEKYADLDVLIDCSPDVLEYMTPTIELTVNGGERVKKILSILDFEETEGYTIHYESGTKVNLYRYKYQSRYDNSEIEGTVTVSYSLKPNVSFSKDLYIFSNYIDFSYTLVNGAAYRDNYTLDETLKFSNKTDVESFLKDFCSRTYERSFSAKMK